MSSAKHDHPEHDGFEPFDPYDLSHLNIEGDEDLVEFKSTFKGRSGAREPEVPQGAPASPRRSGRRFPEEEDDVFLLRNERHNSDPDEAQIRPTRWEEYFGQDRVKENLKVFIAAAKQRGEALDHVLFYGPPGLGKTTLAGIIANEMGSQLRVTSGPAIEKAGDLAAILSNLEPNDVLFIDEIHRLQRQVEEVLYPALEDFAVDIMIGKGPSARSIRLDLPPFTLIGATTRAGLLSAPLRDRFGVVNRLELYKPEELARIIERDAAILGIGTDPEGIFEIAKSSRGTPRIAIRLLKRIRDFAQVKGDGIITGELARESLRALQIDPIGLDWMDLRLLNSMAKNYHGGPVGLETLAASLNEDAVTIEDVIEPYLIQLGFIQKTPRGRVLTHLAYEHLGLTPPADLLQARPQGQGGEAEGNEGQGGEDDDGLTPLERLSRD